MRGRRGSGWRWGIEGEERGSAVQRAEHGIPTDSDRPRAHWPWWQGKSNSALGGVGCQR
jgi:hypothetical protein